MLAEIIRNAIRRSGKSANEIAKATGIPQTTVSRFLRGEEISVGRAGKLAAYFGLALQRASRLA